MNQSVWSNGLYSSSSICLDGCPADHLSPFQLDPMLLNSHKDSEDIKIPPESTYYSSDDADSRLIFSSQLELHPSTDNTPGHLPLGRHSSPASSSHGHPEWNSNSGHQAKRARVENIIKGMTSSPGMHCTDVMANQHEESDGTQENQTIQDPELTERSGSGNQTTRKQHLRQLRTKFSHVDGVTETTRTKYPYWNNSTETSQYSGFQSRPSRKYQGWKKVKLMNYFKTKPERLKLMADVLKYELSRAVSRRVDSIFKSMPPLQTSSKDEGNVDTEMSPQSSVGKDDKLGFSCGGNAVDVQTEALSLVVQKPQLETDDKFILQSRSRAPHRPRPAVLISRDSALRGDQPPEKNPNAACQRALRRLPDGCPEDSRTKFETLDTHWNSVKARSKVNSRYVSGGPMLLESSPQPPVKIESDCLMKNNPYMLNEGLATNHLKKAKLMFFYTRYPSSLVLRMCFHDVQFTRCISSQLIKWFSNFREFYYIQVEKFARCAVGVAGLTGLTVGRESELFRALNTHYNKANDFQVPDRFLEVAEITLREFYIAISMAKDRDPSWKKAIYKVICKLDSDVPAEFKSHHSG